MLPKRLKILSDQVEGVIAAVNQLTGTRVLVGVPQEKSARGDDTGINNAALAYIHNFGSPAQNIPAREFMYSGIRKSLPQVIPQLDKATSEALHGRTEGIDRRMTAAGILAADSVRQRINSNIAPALSPSTVANRARSRGTSSMRENEEVYLDLIAKGVTPEAAQADTDITALVNTAQMRNSITFVVEKK